MPLFHHPADYTVEQGNIRYMDGSRLARPIAMPRSQQIIAGVFVVVAIIIGFRLASNVIGAVSSANEESQASVEENLSRSVTYDLPVLTQLVDMDDQTILDTFAAAGYTVYNQTPDGSSGLDLVKLPADVSVTDAAAMYAKGVSSLSASNAALLLNGSWSLSVDRSDGLSFVVRYADFSSSSLEAAIQSAIAAEGFDTTTISSNGIDTDEVGNTFEAGTVDINGTTYTWRVSATALSDKYDIKGLPDTAAYVGIRLTA